MCGNSIRLSWGKAVAALEGHDQPFRELFSHGSLAVEIYAPKGRDLQEPHTRDEVYVIASTLLMVIRDTGLSQGKYCSSRQA